MQGITIEAQGVSVLGGDIFCQNPEGLEVALAKLREIGYEVSDLRLREDLLKFSQTTSQELEANSTALWFASLNVRRGKCGSCQQYIATRGIQYHGHRCELCGEVTYLLLPKGAKFRFEFREVTPKMLRPQLNMEVICWDADAGWLYLKPELQGRRGLATIDHKQVWEYMVEHADKWDLVEYDGQPAFKVRYTRVGSGLDRSDSVECYDVTGEYFNHQIVRVWQGVEYSQYSSDFPLPEALHIHELWRMADRSQQ